MVSDYKKGERDGSLKILWLNGSFWNKKYLVHGISVKYIFSTIIKSVSSILVLFGCNSNITNQ